VTGNIDVQWSVPAVGRFPFEDDLAPKPTLSAVAASFDGVVGRPPYWVPTRCS
jgi:hypothetical protein